MKNEVYLLKGEFAFKSYIPTDGLKVGMKFLSAIFVGIIEPEHLFFTLESIPKDEDMFMALYGAPVHLIIISLDDDEEQLASEDQIGLFSPEEGDLYPITDKEINTIINEYDSCLDIACTDENEVIFIDGKVIISYLSSENQEDEEDEKQKSIDDREYRDHTAELTAEDEEE